jgi:hypothetical protein
MGEALAVPPGFCGQCDAWSLSVTTRCQSKALDPNVASCRLVGDVEEHLTVGRVAELAGVNDDLALGRWAERNRELAGLDAAELGLRLLVA